MGWLLYWSRDADRSAGSLKARTPARARASSRPRTRLLALGFYVVLPANALAMGAVLDMALRAFGFRLPPVFTILWGSGAILLILAASARSARKRAASSAAPHGRARDQRQAPRKTAA